MITPIIQIEHLVKQYRKAPTPSVDDISFSVEPGEFFAFLGPNGAGKTTTISILTTTLTKTSGRVTIAGYDLDREMQQIREKIGIIFQKPSLDVNLTAEENIRLHVCIQGVYGYKPFYRLMPAAYRQRIEELASVVGLESNLFKPMKTFSGGMQRKLEIIRSLMHEPSILFLDEPTTGLDAVSRSNLWQYLQEMRRTTATTIFLTTHYIDEAENADHVCIINHGKIALHATPQQMKQRLLDRYMLVDAINHEQLQMELTERGIAYKANGAGFKIPYQEATPQTLIARLETPLSVLKVHEPSLEEAYVNLVGVQ
ncbi:MAG: ATP-binding cassette domain-containing protein [Anaerolineae bacterium]|nr:ATP-binding cassette domain-containing protein [Anaerolineae bacterium]